MATSFKLVINDPATGKSYNFEILGGGQDHSKAGAHQGVVVDQ